MSSWWNDLGTLQAYNSRLLWVIGFLGICTSVAVILSLVWADRISDLQDKEKLLIRDRIAANEAATAKAKTDAANAQLETEKLKSLVSWREVTPDNRQKFKDFVLQALKGAVEIRSLSSDAEGANFARQISTMLKEAGYAVTDNLGSITVLGPPPIGVQLQIKSDKDQPQWGGPLQKGLVAIGINADGQVGMGPSGSVLGGVTSPDPNAIVVLVGCKQ